MLILMRSDKTQTILNKFYSATVPRGSGLAEGDEQRRHTYLHVYLHTHHRVYYQTYLRTYHRAYQQLCRQMFILGTVMYDASIGNKHKAGIGHLVIPNRLKEP